MINNPDTLNIFKALSDKTRLRLIFILTHYELNVNELVKLLNMGQSRISRHLKILTDSRLLSWRRSGLWVFYCLNQEEKYLNFWKTILPFLEDNQSFKDDLRLAQIILEERVSKSKLFFNNIADDWDEINRNIMGDFNLVNAILEQFNDCNTAVDLGCGTGLVLEGLLTKAHNVIGVDGSPRMLELANRRLLNSSKNISLRIGDIEHLPLADNEADFACINMVLHHLAEPLLAILEIARILKINGTLIISDFNKHENELMRTEYGDYWLGFTQDELNSYLNKAGFRLENTQTVQVQKQLSILIIKTIKI